MKKVSDESLIDSYSQTGNIWKTAEELGLCGQTVHQRLSNLGVIRKINYWTQEDDEVLKDKYLTYKMSNKLNELATQLGRTKQFICRKAKKLGLTDPKEKHIATEVRKILSIKTKRWIQEKGHPRGMLGKKHTTEVKKHLSLASKRMWSNPLSYVNSDENRQRLSDNLHERKMKGTVKVYSNRGKHIIKIRGTILSFSSSWEKEIAIRLESLKIEGTIKDWAYEAKHFDFPDIKRGMRSYCPDFEVTLCDGSFLYIEVKGWKMNTSMKRIAMFRERYPNVKYYIIDEYEYRKILSQSDYLWRYCIKKQSV